ncbi:MAG: hypothetical protein IJ658_13545 [Kiritimatiellae bacterium]|nr:hypothetical protein [Kiritimatiellia bacterium]
MTILIYTFPRKGSEGESFGKIAASIERTWKHCGRLKTAIVASHRFEEVESFASSHQNVELQVEPSLVPGSIKTMSMDCIKKLYTRFSTPYVLIIQDDGFPVRSGLEEFVGKIDFWGAPIISDGWRRKLLYALGMGSFNGGFSLRSRRLCEYASRKWFSFFRHVFKEDSPYLGEDFYYTTLLKLLPSTWFRFRFPSERAAFRFSFDALGGKVTLPTDVEPFGQHGTVNAAVTVLAYHFWAKEGYDEAFAKVRHAFEETWRHCGRLKSVLVVNETAPCVEQFVAENPNVEVQVEPSLVPGKIFTMSADMNGRLHERFHTPYVLIIQNDGYPLRRGLEDFVGRYDFIGAPYVGLQWWKRLVAWLTNYHVQNGGFSLRSHAICEAAARYWNGKYHALGDCNATSEDIFYTGTLVKKERRYRRSFRLATSRESLAFSWDAIVPIPKPKEQPFGFHGVRSLREMRECGIMPSGEAGIVELGVAVLPLEECLRN